MASGNIRGITIEIGGDTKGLDNALKDVNKQSKDLQGELKAVERGLKFDPGNVELVRQKQELLTASIQSTSEKLDVLKTAQSQVEAQFQRGDIGVEQYRAFQRELQTTENEMTRLQSQLNSLGTDQDRLAQTTRQLGTFFSATNTDVEQFAGTLGTRLTQAIREGSATADQMERALRLMGQQALGAGIDVDQLRTALRTADDGANLNQIRQDLAQIAEEANTAEDAVNGFGQELSSVVGGLAAGGGIAGVVSSALDASSLRTKIDISFNVPEESKQSIYEAVKSIEAYGVEGEEALEGIRRQWALNKDASDESNTAIVEGAAIVAKAYAGIDFIELIQETNEIASELKISNEEALGLTNSLLKLGFPPEQLDIISEYGNQLIRAGYSGEEVQAIFAAGVETGTWNIDNLLDGLKEGRIQLASFVYGLTDANAAVVDEAGVSQKVFLGWAKAVSEGGEKGTQALVEVAETLNGIKDEAAREDLGVLVFGTKFEDQGQHIINTILGAKDATVDLKSGVNELNAAQEKYNADPLIRMKDAFNDVMASLQPLLLMIADFVAKIAEWVSNNVGLAAALVAIGTTLGILTGAFAALMPAIGALVGLWPALVGLIGGIGAPILIAVGAIAGLGLAFTALWKESETFRDTLTTVFNSIKDVVTNVLDVVVTFVKEKVSQIKDFWTSEGQQILAAVENAFNGIKGIIETIMPAVQFVIEYVWKAIQNVINGALDFIMGAVKVFSGLFTGDFSKMWEGVKQIFSGAIDLIMGLMSLSFVGGIRTLVANLAKSFINIIKTKWTTVVGLFKNSVNTVANTISSWVGNTLGFIRNLATNFTSTVRNLATTVVNRFKDLATNAINAVKDLPSKMIQIGKDLIQGFINGIKDKAGEAVKAISGVVDSVLDTAKNILGIASPSRVMKQIGKWTGEGLALGIDDTQGTVKKAIEELGGILIDVAENNIQQEKEIRKKADADILKLRKDATDKIADLEKKSSDKILGIQESASKKKKGMTAAQQRALVNSRSETAAKILKIEQDTAAKIAKIDAKAKSDSAKLISVNQKEVLEEIKLFISDKQSLEQMNLIQEAAIWEKSIGLFEEGSKERIEAQKAYQKSLETINAQIVSINRSFQSEMQKVNDDLIKNIQAENDMYENAYSSRVDSIRNFKGMFDEFVGNTEKSGTDLLSNLQSQVTGLELWKETIASLGGRISDENLMEELQGLGPSAVGELQALNSLSDEQLSQYVGLYNEKFTLAREQASLELSGMKEDTVLRIDEMKEAANEELEVLQSEWDKAIRGITKATDTELSSLKQIGRDAGQGLYDGLASMEPSLIAKARSIANAISSAIQSALDIHSPSRVMKGFGINIGEGLIVGMDEMINKVAHSSARLSDAVINAQSSLASSAQKSMRYGSNVTSSTTSTDNSKTFAPVVNITTTTSGDKAMERTLRRLAFQFN